MLHDCGVFGLLNRYRDLGLFNPYMYLGFSFGANEGFGRAEERSDWFLFYCIYPIYFYFVIWIYLICLNSVFILLLTFI